MFHVDTKTRHDRRLAYRPGKWLAVIDRLVSNKERTFEQWFHLHEDLKGQISAANNTWLVDLPDGGRMRAIARSTADGCELRRLRGATEPRLQGWISREYRSFKPNDAIGHACRAKDITMVTLFIIEEAGRMAPIDLVATDGAVPWSVRDDRDGVVADLGAAPAIEAVAAVDSRAKPAKAKKPKKTTTGKAEAAVLKIAPPLPKARPALSAPAKPTAGGTQVAPSAVWKDRFASMPSTGVVGLAMRGSDGTYRAKLGQMIFAGPGSGWKKVDELEISFRLSGLAAEGNGPPAFAIVCHARRDRPCDMIGGQGRSIGKGRVSGSLGRYYDAGAFARGAIVIRDLGQRVVLTGEARMVSGTATGIERSAVLVEMELVPLEASGTKPFIAEATSYNCKGMDPTGIFAELSGSRYRTVTFDEIARNGVDPKRVNVLVRHDIDHSMLSSADLGALAAANGVRSTFFVHLGSGFAAAMSTSGQYTRNPDLLPRLKALQSMGHEIGYQTDALMMDVFLDLRMDRWLAKALADLRGGGLAIQSEASNGSPFGKRTGAHNRFSFADFREGGRLSHLVNDPQRERLGFSGDIDVLLDGRRYRRSLPRVRMADVGLRHAAYYPETYGVDRKTFVYLTDSRLNGEQILDGLRRAKPGAVVQVLMHPWRWASCHPGYAGLAQDKLPQKARRALASPDAVARQD